MGAALLLPLWFVGKHLYEIACNCYDALDYSDHRYDFTKEKEEAERYGLGQSNKHTR